MLKCSERLSAGDPVSDAEFDSVYEADVRAASNLHWTPVAVAQRAAQLLTTVGGATRVLDVGAGPGKFCIVGALTTSAQFFGVERRTELAAAAHMAIHRFRAERAKVVHADFVSFDCRQFDGFYFYNPFESGLRRDFLAASDPVDMTVETFRTLIAVTVARLIQAPPGTAVVTYHGFGGRMPRHYDRIIREPAGEGEIAVWVRSAHAAA